MDIASLGISVDTRQVKQAEGALDGLAVAGGRAERSTRGLSKAMAGELAVAARSAIGFLGAAGLAREALRAADAMTALDSRLRLVTSSAMELGSARAGILDIAQAARQSLSETGSLYFRIAKGAETLGLHQGQVLALTQTINQTLALSGASATSAQAALIQFGQALASGVLRGEELNSVMEQAPALAEAIAKGLGVTVGQLRDLGQEGKLTVDAILGAINKQAPEIAKQFSQVAPTVSQAWVQLTNAATAYVGASDRAHGSTAALASVIQTAAEDFNNIAAALAVSASVGMGAWIGKAAEARVEILAQSLAVQSAAVVEAEASIQIARSRAMRAEAALAEATQQRALMAEMSIYGPARGAIERQITAAASARSAAVLAVTAAESRLASATGAAASATAASTVALNGARAVLAALGGPIGAVITALTVGATAWALFGTEAENSADRAAKAFRKVAEEAARTGKTDKVVAESRREEARKALQAEAAALNMGTGGTRERLAQLQEEYRAYSEIADQAAERERNFAALQAQTPAKVDKKAEAEAKRAAKAAETEARRRAEELEALRQSMLGYTATLEEQVAKEAAQVEAIGMTSEAVAEKAAAESEATAATYEHAAAQLEELGLHEAYREQLKAQAAALRELASLKRQAVTKEATVEAAKKATREWEKFYDDLERGLTDALYRGFENGKGAGENFLDSLENMLKSAALKITVQAIVDPIMGGIQGVLGGGGGIGGAVSGIGNLFSAGSSLGNLFGGNTGGGLLGGIFGSSAAYGSLFGAEAGAMLAGQTGVFGASGLGATMSAGGLTGGGLLSGIGAALPWVGGALALGSLFGGGLFGDDGAAQRSATVWQSGMGGDVNGATSAFGAFNINANNQWFGQGTESVGTFQQAIKSLDDQIALLLTDPQKAAVIAALKSDQPTQVQFGQEWTDWTQSGAPEAIMAERYTLVLNAIKPGLADLAKQAGWSSDKILELVKSLTETGEAADDAAKPIEALQRLLAAADRSIESTTRTMEREEARRTIEKAVRVGAKGISLSRVPGLEAAVSAAGNLSERDFRTREEFLRYQAMLNRSLDQLRPIVAAQIATAGVIETATTASVPTTAAAPVTTAAAPKPAPARPIMRGRFDPELGYFPPGFASGGWHGGGWRMVGESGPELEYTPPARIYSASDSRKMMDTESLENEVRKLREDLKASQLAIAKYSQQTANMLNRWDGDGIPETRVIA